MTAATMTPAAASAELLIEMYELVRRCDDNGGYLDDLNECGELADNLSTALRRFRGRIMRLARKAAERPAPTTEAAAESAPAVKAEHEPATPAQAVDQTPPSSSAPRAARRAPLAMRTALRTYAARARTRVVRWSRRAAFAGRFGNFVRRVPPRGDRDASNWAGGSPTDPGGVR